MPMVVYTEEEVIESCERAVADQCRQIENDLAKAMADNTMLRKTLNDLRDALTRIADSPTINNHCGWYPEMQAAKRLLGLKD